MGASVTRELVQNWVDTLPDLVSRDICREISGTLEWSGDIEDWLDDVFDDDEAIPARKVEKKIWKEYHKATGDNAPVAVAAPGPAPAPLPAPVPELVPAPEAASTANPGQISSPLAIEPLEMLSSSDHGSSQPSPFDTSAPAPAPAPAAASLSVPVPEPLPAAGTDQASSSLTVESGEKADSNKAGLSSTLDLPPNVKHLTVYIAALRNKSDETGMTNATRCVRKILSVESPPVREVIDRGVIPLLVDALKYIHNQRMQLEAAWALTNISSSDYTDWVTVDSPPNKRNAVPYLIQLMRSPSPDVREQCCWCLANVAGDSPELRDEVLANPNAMKNVILNIVKAPNKSMLNNATWTLSNMCRGEPPPPRNTVLPAIQVFRRVFVLALHPETGETEYRAARDALWGLAYLSDADDERIQDVLNSGCLPDLIRCLEHSQSVVVTPALRVVGNITSGSDEQTRIVVESGALPVIGLLLNHEKINIRKESCWLLSNVAAASLDQVRAFLDARVKNHPTETVLSRVFANARSGPYEVSSEAIYALANVCTGLDPTNIARIVGSGAQPELDVFIQVLQHRQEPRMKLVALEAIQAVYSGWTRSKTMSQELELALHACATDDDTQVFTLAVALVRELSDGNSDDSDDSDGFGNSMPDFF